ncbi:MAG: hypothetical protein D6729_08390 [Deltaproteobacteria bacterium]|nr:MAG: hypothetical protein D6729_08390 [Deltaproteobacteria bacterium]
MQTLETLVERARDIVRRGLAFAGDVEVRIVRTDAYGYEVKNRELAPQMSLGRVEVGLRALTPKGLAIAATTTLDLDENEAALRAALPAARPSPLERFGATQVEPTTRWHDATWEPWITQPEKLRDLAAALRDRAFAEGSGRLDSLEGGVSLSTTWTVLASRDGLAAFKRTTGDAAAFVNACHYQLAHLDRAPDESGLESIRDLGRRTLSEIPDRVVAPADLGVRGKVTAILHPRLVESLLRVVGQEKFLGSSLRTGLTEIEPGRRIFHPSITLVDTGTDEGLSCARPCDDELSPTGSTPLVEEGVAKGLVWSRRSAAEAGRETTGNGYRRPMLVEDESEAPVRDTLSGLVMAPGEISREALFEGVDRGVYLLACLGLHGADRARAAFTASVFDGFAIEDGRITALLAPGRWNVSGRILDGEGEQGVFSEVTLSQETHVGPRARLPWIRTTVTV